MITIPHIVEASAQAVALASEQIHRTLNTPDPAEGFAVLKQEFLAYLEQEVGAPTPALKKALDSLERVPNAEARYDKLLEVTGAWIVAYDRGLIEHS